MCHRIATLVSEHCVGDYGCTIAFLALTAFLWSFPVCCLLVPQFWLRSGALLWWWFSSSKHLGSSNQGLSWQGDLKVQRPIERRKNMRERVRMQMSCTVKLFGGCVGESQWWGPVCIYCEMAWSNDRDCLEISILLPHIWQVYWDGSTLFFLFTCLDSNHGSSLGHNY